MSVKMNMVRASFTTQQVEALNAFQKLGYIHPFTCEYAHPEGRNLRATEDGWHCTYPGCAYTQNWAYEFMTVKDLHPPMPAILKSRKG
jgi:hypothetical protein